MGTRSAKPAKSNDALPPDYASLLADIKMRVQSARIRAGLAANRELLTLYWDIGRLILDRQKREGWGAKVIDRLSADLQREFPGQEGFSPRNLKYMRAFAEAWPETVIIQQQGVASVGSGEMIVHPPGAQLSPARPAIVHRPGAQLPWKHHCLLLEKLRSKNRVIAEYALRDLSKPIGVSGVVTKLVDSLPRAFKGAVPTIAELEKGLAKE